MADQYTLPKLLLNPVAPITSVHQTTDYRLTFLTSRLFRFESSLDGAFENRASTFAINRNLPSPKFDLVNGPNGSTEVFTDHLVIEYDGKEFSPGGFTVTLKEKCKWRYLTRCIY